MIFNSLELQEKLQRVVILLALLCTLWSPVYTFILLGIGFAIRNNAEKRKFYTVVLIALLVVCAMVFDLEDVSYVFPNSIQSYFLEFMPIRMMASIVITIICLYFAFGSVDSWMIIQEKRRREKIYIPDAKLEFNNRSHVFIAGTTGSGKTQLINRYIKDSLKNKEQLYIVSGKCSNDSNSLLDDVISMCNLYGRKLYIVSMNPQRKNRTPYNPFKKCKVTQLADMLVNASEFTEPHYKYSLSTWVKSVCELIEYADMDFSLEKIIFFMNYENYYQLCKKLLKDKIITDEKANEYLSYKDIATVANSSRARFLNILLGEGKEILGNDHAISAKDVREENAVLYVDLDSFSYNDFTSIVGAFFIDDMRNLISSEPNRNPKRIIMDELSSYVTEQIMPLFSQSRSFGYQMVVATQSIADIQQISDKLAIRIMENCGQYGILQLNSAEDAEMICQIIGTEVSVETTRKSTGNHLHPTADGSKKVVNSFKVSPDAIKELQSLEVIFYDKKKPSHAMKIKMKYGWEND